MFLSISNVHELQVYKVHVFLLSTLASTSRQSFFIDQSWTVHSFPPSPTIRVFQRFGHSRPLFFLFSSVKLQLIEIELPMLVFEAQISGVGRNCSSNCATTIAKQGLNSSEVCNFSIKLSELHLYVCSYTYVTS